MSNATSLPPAGWYADKSEPGQERWWDGSAWTDHSRAQQPPHAHQPPTSEAGFKCPKCGSRDAKSLRAVREQGTTTGSGMTSGWISGSGDQPGHSATLHTTMTSRTAAAGAAAPPRKRHNGIALMVSGPFFGLIVAIAGMPLLAGAQLSALAFAAAVLVAFVVMFFGSRLYSTDAAYNREEYPEDYERWARSWSCQRCGEVFAV